MREKEFRKFKYPLPKSLLQYKEKRTKDWECMSVAKCLPHMHKILTLSSTSNTGQGGTDSGGCLHITHNNVHYYQADYLFGNTLQNSLLGRGDHSANEGASYQAWWPQFSPWTPWGEGDNRYLQVDLRPLNVYHSMHTPHQPQVSKCNFLKSLFLVI